MTARGTPYDLAFSADFERENFTAIRAEAEQRELTSWQPDEFLLLHAVAEPLRRSIVLRPGETRPGPGPNPETAVEQFAPLLFQGYHYWRFEKPLFVLTEPLFRFLVGDLHIGSWEQVPPAPAGYLQLPRNLLWARIAENAAPEAVDGFFWTMVGRGDARVPPFDRIDLLLVLGLVQGRPGFSVIPLSLELTEPQGHWGDEQARAAGRDFANNLPGGELQRLHALETTGEAWKLASRVFWYVAQHPDSFSQDTRELHLVNRG
jgi:hypothetical protein